MQTVNKPLLIEVLGDNNGQKRGETLKQRVVVNNKGTQPAEVDLWIAATDDKSEVVLRWCTFNKPNPLKLDANSQETVELTFEIPLEATIDLYNYEILVDAQSQYPGKIDRRPQQLRILPSEQDAELDHEPTFSLQPTTSSTQPFPLLPGETLDVNVKIENRSKRVDRFYVSCPEFDQSWISIRYPESTLETTGLGRETDGLELNPGKSGEIALSIHPPQYTPAGNYFPTVRLTSSIKDKLVLLDVVYLQLMPDERIAVQLNPSVRRVPAEPGLFTIDLTNSGNLDRKLILRASDPEQLFVYTLEPFIAKLTPGTTQAIELRANPKKWWHRPWRGRGVKVPLTIELDNLQDKLRPELVNLALPQEMPSGAILWQPHPWWRWWLLILLALGAVGAIAFAIWLTWFYKSPPSELPQILKVESTADPKTKEKKQYQEGFGDAVRLDWKISHLERIEKVVVIRLENNVETDRKTFSFDGQIKDPLQHKDKLNNFCEPTDSNPNNAEKVVSCNGIITSAQKAGNYVFELQVFAIKDQNSKRDFNQPVATLKTDTITIKPALPPKIVEFSATKPTYQESVTQTIVSPAISLPTVAVSPTPTTSPAATVSPAVSQTPLPLPSPRLSEPTTGLIRLNWEVNNPIQIKELKVVGVAPDGSISSPLKRYPFAKGILPAELQPYCIQAASLVCQNVPTDAIKAGDYTFKLVVVPQQASDQEIMKTTEVIKIIAQTPKISFQVDGQDVDQNPKLVYEIGPSRQPIEVTLSWKVEGPDGLKVELLPAPGQVKPDDQLKFPLGKSSSSETLTLKVTNRSGEQVEKSVVIQSVEVKPPTRPTPANSGGVTGGASGSTGSPTSSTPPPTPSDPSQLSPIELPPRP